MFNYVHWVYQVDPWWKDHILPPEIWSQISDPSFLSSTGLGFKEVLNTRSCTKVEFQGDYMMEASVVVKGSLWGAWQRRRGEMGGALVFRVSKGSGFLDESQLYEDCVVFGGVS